MLEIVAVLLGTIVTGTAAQEPDQGALAGEWSVTRTEQDGRTTEDGEAQILRLEADRFSLVGAGGAVIAEGRYSIDPTHEPRRIDFAPTDGGVWLGVYKLDGNDLVLAHGPQDAKGARPDGFGPSRGSSVILRTLRRAGVP
jgi:uncharacterized protein (TIGR03067 family)